MKRILACAAAVLLVALYLGAQPPKTKMAAAKAKAVATAPAYGNSDAITELELKVYDYFLASDQLEGRNLPSRGFDTAALYVASHLAEWGLKPAGSTEGTDGPLQPYFMPFELATRSVVEAESKISLTGAGGGGRGRGGRGGGGGGGRAAAAGVEGAAPAGGRGGNAEPRTTEFAYGKDWTTTGGGRGAAPLSSFDLSGSLAFVGNGYIVNKTKTDPYEGLNVTGKIVVVAGLPPEIAAQQEAAAAGGGRGGGGGATNPLGEPCTDFLNPEQAAAKHGAIAVITLPTFQQLSAANGGGGRGGFGGGGANGPNYIVPKLNAKPACPVVPAISAGLTLANAIFQGQSKTAAQVFYGAGSGTKQDSFELKPETKISLKLTVKSEPGHAENVVAMLEGSDPVKKNEYVVISAHLDHIGLSNAAPGADNINNGADDDGSGSTALLGIAHAYAEGAAKGIRPERTIIFLWNAGEEKGLWGSQYFAEFPPVDITKIVADLNIDMIGRTAPEGYKDPDPTHLLVKPNEIMVVGPNISSADMEKTLETVNNAYQKLNLNHFYDVTAPDKDHDNLGPQPRGQRIFYRSDHYNFAKVGIPIVFFTDGLHVDYHRVTDTPDKIDYPQMVKVSRTVSAISWVLANQAGRPKLNEKLPDQLVKDMKLAKDQGWGVLTPVMKPLPGEPF
jgi:Zn-dependent M28 family amino/carboxypeptidase